MKILDIYDIMINSINSRNIDKANLTEGQSFRSTEILFTIDLKYSIFYSKYYQWTGKQNGFWLLGTLNIDRADKIIEQINLFLIFIFKKNVC